MNIAECRAIEAAYESLSQEQVLKIESMLKTHRRADIAKEVKISESKLRRASKKKGWSFTAFKAIPYMKYSKELTEQVISYFEANGKTKTQEKFPDVVVRSIVERYKRNQPRQSRWTDEQIIQAIRFGPFVNYENQAKYFNRPRANKGSIVSLWQKRIKCTPFEIHGLPEYKAKYFIRKSCPFIITAVGGYKLYLWSSIEENISNNCPEFIREIISSMSEFQRLLYNGSPEDEIKKIIKTLELREE